MIVGFRGWLNNKESRELVTKSDFFRTGKIMYFISHFMRSCKIILLKMYVTPVLKQTAAKYKCIKRNSVEFK